MKKLKEKPINPFSIGLLIICFVNCKGNTRIKENNDKQGNVSHERTLTKDFFSCTGARDTVFANGDCLKYILVDKEHYEIEIKINDVLDTLVFHLNCKTNSGMIPKVLFRSDLGYLGLGQGSSSYKYLTLCILNKEGKEIEVSTFQTGRDVSSEHDGFLFVRDNWLYLYDKSKNKFLCKKLPGDGRSLTVKEFALYNNRAALIFDDGGSLSYPFDEFIAKDNIPSAALPVP